MPASFSSARQLLLCLALILGGGMPCAGSGRTLIQYGFDYTSDWIDIRAPDFGEIVNDAGEDFNALSIRFPMASGGAYSGDIPQNRQFSAGIGSLDLNTGITGSGNFRMADLLEHGGITMEIWVKGNLNREGQEGELMSFGGQALKISKTSVKFGAITAGIDRTVWTHIAGIISNTTNIAYGIQGDLSLYVNGVLAGTAPVNNYVPTKEEMRILRVGSASMIYEPRISLGHLIPAEFTWKAPSPVLDISVDGPDGVPLDAGKSLVDFAVKSGEPSVTRAFTVRNAGSREITGLKAIIEGPQASSFHLGNPPGTAIPPGGSTVFDVVFDSPHNGRNTAILRLSGADAERSSFDIKLVSPHWTTSEAYKVTAPSGNIGNGGTLDFGAFSSAEENRIITITNTGNTTLALTSYLTGANPGDFTVTPASFLSPEPGEELLVTVRCRPQGAGVRTAVLNMTTDFGVPFELNLSGAIASPEVAMETEAGLEIPQYGTFPFGNLTPGIPIRRTLRIRNTGSGPLALGQIRKEGNQASDFILLSGPEPGSLIPAGEHVNLTVEINPPRSGLYKAVLRLESNDLDENSFHLNLSAAASGPGLSLEQPAGIALRNGDAAVDFGTALSGGTVIKTFTLRNPGEAPLQDLTVSIGGQRAEDFTVLTPEPKLSPLTAGSGTAFAVAFSPKKDGASEAMLVIASNIAAHNPFSVTLTGTGAGAVPQPVSLGRGTGADGPLVISETWEAGKISASLPVGAFSGESFLKVGSVSGFAAGQMVGIIQMTGIKAGQTEEAMLSGVEDGRLLLQSPLKNTFPASVRDAAQVMVIPQNTDITIAENGKLTCGEWNGAAGIGGVVWLKATGTLMNHGVLDVSGKGFAGGPPGTEGGAGGGGGEGGKALDQRNGGAFGGGGAGGGESYPGEGQGGNGGGRGYAGSPSGPAAAGAIASISSASTSLVTAGSGGSAGKGGTGGAGAGGGGLGGANYVPFQTVSPELMGTEGERGGNGGPGGGGGNGGGLVIVDAEQLAGAGRIVADGLMGMQGSEGLKGGNGGAGGKGRTLAIRSFTGGVLGPATPIMRYYPSSGGGGGAGAEGGRGGDGGSGGQGGTVLIQVNASAFSGVVSLRGGDPGKAGVGGAGGLGGPGGAEHGSSVGAGPGRPPIAGKPGSSGPSGAAGLQGSSGLPGGEGYFSLRMQRDTRALWQSRHFTSAEAGDLSISGPLADTDGDGLGNLLEFAFNLDPRRSDSQILLPGSGLEGLPVAAVQDSEAGPRLVLEYLRRRASGSPGISCQAIFADDPSGPWQPAAEETVTPIDDLWERVSAPDPAAPGASRRFGHVRVLEQP